MNMHPGPPQHAQIDELLVGGNDKEGANLDTARWRERQAQWMGMGTGDVCTTCTSAFKSSSPAWRQNTFKMKGMEHSQEEQTQTS